MENQSQEYPIRALVLVNAITTPRLKGAVLAMRRCIIPDCQCTGYWAEDKVSGVEHYFFTNEVTIDPSPQDIAEERAKAGLPADHGEAVPERSEGAPPPESPAPSVPMGGDDMVAAIQKYGRHLEDCLKDDSTWNDGPTPCTCGLDAILAKLEVSP